MRKINIVPKDTELENCIIPSGIHLSAEMKGDLVQLHRANPTLYNIIIQDAEAANKVAVSINETDKKFDFNWDEYTLRDVVMRQYVTLTEFKENLRMLELTDIESSKILRDMTSELMDAYATLLLYYGAPADSKHAFSHVRFIDVIGVTFPKNKGVGTDTPIIRRKPFLRYTREL